MDIEKNLLDEKISILQNHLQNNINEKNFNKEIVINELKDSMVKRKKKIQKQTEKYDEIKEKEKKKFKLLDEFKNKYETFDNEILNNPSFQYKLPTFLFFHKNILDKYKLCPFIEINETDNLLFNRYNWLLQQDDKGILYFDLYDKYINKIENVKNKNNKKNLEEFFNTFHLEFLNVEQYTLLNTTKEYLDEYIKTNIKSKKIKDKFNIIINNTSLLISETNLNIHEYLSILYNIYIPINNINKIDKNDKFYSIEYNENILKLKELNIEIENVENNIINTINNLKNDLYNYLYTNLHKIKNQTGKYFKRWSLLTNEEKIDRFYSYSDFVSSKYLNETNIEKNEIDNIIHLLKKLLKDNLHLIKYKNIKWDILNGIITNINCLKYNEDNKQFYLNDISTKETIQSTKKISSIRTILNKETCKIINNELLNFLIFNKENNKLKPELITDLKNEFLELIKLHFKVKRLTLHDSEDIVLKFDKMFHIIYNIE